MGVEFLWRLVNRLAELHDVELSLPKDRRIKVKNPMEIEKPRDNFLRFVALVRTGSAVGGDLGPTGP